MLYTKKDIPHLTRQAENKVLGDTVRRYYRECVEEIERNGKVDTEHIRRDNDGDK